ncbi:hypothetical protein NIES4072_29140 [Nostoc commune NIES-4072]|uniref:Uncharacterized protein n=1 Tax=Nostoc commune NIES-4072 TaxID=2005467 RepID=A0A2R5FKF1_NOSCO|nr:hypothetical protein NIES4070_61610 [Nostoc commune HK-02]GBG19247.1 hypothetical protein NIES4072_29140 [Nostoc commune NIES-4072]
MLIDNILLAKIDIIKMKPQINTDDLSMVKKLILDFCQTSNVIPACICELFITVKNASQPQVKEISIHGLFMV